MNTHSIAKRQLTLCFEMLEKLIETTPDSVWNEKRGGFVFWQQIFHALTGSTFWLRSEGGPFNEPFEGRNLYPELDGEPEAGLTREEIMALFNETAELREELFRNLSEERLTKPSPLYDKISSLDVVFGQVRHLMYHIGHCNAILRDLGHPAVEWVDFYGE